MLVFCLDTRVSQEDAQVSSARLTLTACSPLLGRVRVLVQDLQAIASDIKANHPTQVFTWHLCGADAHLLCILPTQQCSPLLGVPERSNNLMPPYTSTIQ